MRRTALLVAASFVFGIVAPVSRVVEAQEPRDVRAKAPARTVEIAKDTAWENQVLELTGRIRVRDGATLRVLNTTIRFRSAPQLRCGILLEGSAALIMKNSEVTAEANIDNVREKGWFLVAGSVDREGKQPLIDEQGRLIGGQDGERRMLLKAFGPEEPRTIVQIDGCRLFNIGGSRSPQGGPGIWFWKVRRGSRVRNTLFENPGVVGKSRRYVRAHTGHTVFVWRNGAFVEIMGNRFRNLGCAIMV